MKTNTKLLLAAGAAVALLFLKRKNGVSGIGKVERVKRRIYKEVSLAQSAGVDFSKKFAELTQAEIEALENVAHKVGWKQTKRAQEKGTPYAESYYNSLRRAWNAVSGVRGIGTTYDVKNANGQVVLRWIEDAEKHYEREAATLEAERRAAEARKRLRNMRRTTTPLAPTPNKTIQQQILEKVPYLRTVWREDPKQAGLDSAVRDDFQWVVWIEVINKNNREKVFEGAKVATLSKSLADEIANDERRTVKWNREEADRNNRHLTEETRISVIPVTKVNLDKISGTVDF